MKKILIITLFILGAITRPVFADDGGGSDGIEGMMDSTSAVEDAFVGQKKVSDETFQNTLNAVKAQQGKGKRLMRPFVGKDYNDDSNSGNLSEVTAKNLLLGIPVVLENGDGTEIPIGHYKIIGERKDNKVFLNFYQSYTLVARVPAIETTSDFNEPGMYFIKLTPYNEQRVKIIYGSMDFNAYTFIKIKEEISDQN